MVITGICLHSGGVGVGPVRILQKTFISTLHPALPSLPIPPRHLTGVVVGGGVDLQGQVGLGLRGSHASRRRRVTSAPLRLLEGARHLGRGGGVGGGVSTGVMRLLERGAYMVGF